MSCRRPRWRCAASRASGTAVPHHRDDRIPADLFRLSRRRGERPRHRRHDGEAAAAGPACARARRADGEGAPRGTIRPCDDGRQGGAGKARSGDDQRCDDRPPACRPACDPRRELAMEAAGGSAFFRARAWSGVSAISRARASIRCGRARSMSSRGGSRSGWTRTPASEALEARQKLVEGDRKIADADASGIRAAFPIAAAAPQMASSRRPSSRADWISRPAPRA